MKNLLLILFSCICMYSCTTSTYEIKGKVENKALYGTTIFLRQRINRVWTSIDSTKIENGCFRFHGKADTAKIAYVSYQFSTEKAVRQAFILENGKIAVSIDKTGFMNFKGTVLNDSLQSYQSAKNEFSKKAEIAYKSLEDSTITPEKLSELNQKVAKLNEEEISLDKKYAIRNINTIVGTFVFTNSFYAMTTAEKESIVNLMNEETKQVQRIKEIIADIETEKKVAVGKIFTDFKLPSLTGDSTALSDLVGKTDYVLVDFWASWCGPCMHSLPELKKLYNIYKGTRFEVFGVSLDEDAEAWKAVINSRQLTWKHASDLKGWKCVGSRTYAVNSIPSTILINKKGEIVGKNLTFQEIEKFLDKKNAEKQ